MNNPSSQIFEKFYDRIVAVISKDKGLNECFIETLYNNILFPAMEKKSADQLVCLDIKARTVMRFLSSFISRTMTPEKALAKVLMILGKFQKLETLATDMRKEGIIFVVIISINNYYFIDHTNDDIQMKLVDSPQPEIKRHVLETPSSTRK